MKASAPTRVRSVQWRIMARQLPLLVLIFFGVLYWFGEHLRGILLEADLEMARHSSRLVVSAVQATMESERTHETWSRILESIPNPDHTHVEVISRAGEVLFATEPALIGTRHRLTDSRCSVCHENGARQAKRKTAHVSGSDAEPFQIFVTPLENTAACRRCHEKEPGKLGMVYVRQPLEPVNRQVRTIQLALALAGAVTLLLTVFTTRILLGRHLGRPLKLLAKGAERIGGGDLGREIELQERTELSLLADTLNNSSARLRVMVGTLASQRNDFQTLYGLADQLSRSVLPEGRRRRCVQLASQILKKECVLVRAGSQAEAGPAEGTVTFRGPDGRITDISLEDATEAGGLPSFYDRGLVERWLGGEFDEAIETRVGSTVAYALRRRGRRRGLLLAPAGDFAAPEEMSDPGMVSALVKHLGIALAYSDLQREVISRERLAAVGETVAGLAHCMKNVLNGLRAGIYVTQRAMELEDDEKLANGWRVLKKSVGQVERITFDMLYYIKERTPHREPVDPNAVVGEIIDLLQEDAIRKGVELRAELAETMGDVLLDRTTIFRAVLNLAGNAIDACVESETGDLVSIRSEIAGDEVVLTVEDNGIGMPEAVQQRLFTHLFSTKQSQGTGLGLPVVRKIVEEHGGSLEFDSEPGRGSTFRIRLPVVGPEPPEAPTER